MKLWPPSRRLVSPICPHCGGWRDGVRNAGFAGGAHRRCCCSGCPTSLTVTLSGLTTCCYDHNDGTSSHITSFPSSGAVLIGTCTSSSGAWGVGTTGEIAFEILLGSDCAGEVYQSGPYDLRYYLVYASGSFSLSVYLPGFDSASDVYIFYGSHTATFADLPFSLGSDFSDCSATDPLGGLPVIAYGGSAYIEVTP